MVTTENSASLPYIPVADFYSGKSVFLTGGTGFLGKVFYRLIKKSPENLKKVKFVSGELTQVDLGINPEDLKILREEVSIVFHLAATVKFNEPLSVAMKVNVEGTEEVLKLSRNMNKIKVSIVFHLAATVKFNEPLSVAMKVNVEGTEEVLKLSRNMNKIKVFVYMSTIFANTDHEIKVIEEKLYPCPKRLDEVYRMIENHDQDKVFIQEELEGRPNTYTFTKALAEHLIVQKHGSLPVIVIRPSIVTPAKEEPLKGWTDNWMGPTPVQFLIAKGWCRSLYGNDHYRFEIIPVDYVVNLTIISTARFNSSKEVEIYNSCSSFANPLIIRNNIIYLLKESRRQKFHELPFPGITFTTSWWLLTLRRLLFEYLPAYAADIILFIARKPVRFVRLQRWLSSCASAIKYFSSQNWVMKMPNGQALYRSLNDEDQNTFPCDPRHINWAEYIANYFNGIRKFLLKEEQMKSKNE